jgi:hypothetical protein
MQECAGVLNGTAFRHAAFISVTNRSHKKYLAQLHYYYQPSCNPSGWDFSFFR